MLIWFYVYSFLFKSDFEIKTNLMENSLLHNTASLRILCMQLYREKGRQRMLLKNRQQE